MSLQLTSFIIMRYLNDVAVMQTAEKAWTDAIAIDPSNPNSWSNRGTTRLQFGRWQDAREDLQKALELESKTGEPSGMSCYQFGRCAAPIQCQNCI